MSACALFCAVIFLFLSASAASPEDGGAEKQAGIALLTRLLEKNNELLLQKMQSMIDEALLYQPPHGRTEPQRPRRLADDAGITCASDDQQQQQQQGQEQQATLLLGTERGEIRFGTEADVNLYSTAPASGNGARILKTDSDFSANSVATANGADVDALATAVGANAEKVAALEALDVAARLGAVEASLANLRQSSPAPTAPSDAPTTAPSESPTTPSPTSPAPTTAPTTSRPSSSPSEAPTDAPSQAPTTSPTAPPTRGACVGLTFHDPTLTSNINISPQEYTEDGKTWLLYFFPFPSAIVQGAQERAGYIRLAPNQKCVLDVLLVGGGGAGGARIGGGGGGGGVVLVNGAEINAGHNYPIKVGLGGKASAGCSNSNVGTANSGDPTSVFGVIALGGGGGGCDSSAITNARLTYS